MNLIGMAQALRFLQGVGITNNIPWPRQVKHCLWIASLKTRQGCIRAVVSVYETPYEYSWCILCRTCFFNLGELGNKDLNPKP